MIIRNPARERYVNISKVPLEDERLSWKARGLHAYLMSKPDNWNVIVEHLVKQGPDGKAAVMAGLKELEELGYIRRTKRRRDGERFDGIDSEVFEEPVLPGQPESRFSVDGKPVDGKSTTNEQIPLMNNEVTLTSSKSYRASDPSHQHRSHEARAAAIYDTYPRKMDRAKAIAKIVALLRKGERDQDLLDAVAAYAATKIDSEAKYIKLAATFFNESWREWVAAAPKDAKTVSQNAREANAQILAEREQVHAESVAMPSSVKESLKKLRGNL